MVPNNTNMVTSKDWENPGPWLKSMLNEHIVSVVFTKKDGSERTMRCTTNETLLPPKKEGTETRLRKENQNVMPVYDLEKQGWRSFTLSAVKSVSFELVEPK